MSVSTRPVVEPARASEMRETMLVVLREATEDPAAVSSTARVVTRAGRANDRRSSRLAPLHLLLLLVAFLV